CIVVLRIARRKEQRHATAANGSAQRRNRTVFRVELARVAAAELGPSGRIVVEPSPQRRAWSELLQPEVDVGSRFGQVPRPEPIDEDSDAIVLRRILVSAFDLDLFYE